MIEVKNNSGFTVIELLVTAGIFIVIFTVAIIDFRNGESINSLQIATDQVAADIRTAQTETLSGSDKSEITAAGGFGVDFDLSVSNGQYTFFRDDGSNNFDNKKDSIISLISLPPNITLAAVAPQPLSIVFTPPKPDTYINGISNAGNNANIILFSSKINNKQGVVTINSFTGRVTAEIQDR